MRIARNLTASLRHRLAAATFAVVLLLPVAMLLIPKQVVTVPAGVPTLAEVTAVAPAAVRPSSQVAAEEIGAINWSAIAKGIYLAGTSFFLISLLGGVCAARTSTHACGRSGTTAAAKPASGARRSIWRAGMGIAK